ncbi:MAG: FAD-binding oxidoreductase [Candidatus Methylomirabilales bacterium]
MRGEIIRPTSVEEVAQAVREAHARRRRIQVVGRGIGLKIEGWPEEGSLLDLSGMDRILSIEKGDLLARVEAGVIHRRVQEAVEAEGLFFPPDPTSLNSSTVGGNAASGAFGPRSLKYGGMGDFILGMEVVLPNGELVKMGANTKKCVAGYDIARFFIGSKGRFGIIAALTLRLLPLPQKRRLYEAVFPDPLSGAQAALAVIRRGMTPSALELLDGPSLKAIGLEEKALLLVEVDGVETSVQRKGDELRRIFQEMGCLDFWTIDSSHEMALTWEARRSLLPSLIRGSPTWLFIRMAVGRHQLPDLLRGLPPIAVQQARFAHAGSGILHLFLGFDPQDGKAVEEARQLDKAIPRRLQELQGSVLTVCGPARDLLGAKGLGVGEGWAAKLLEIQRAFDPQGILG